MESSRSWAHSFHSSFFPLCCPLCELSLCRWHSNLQLQLGLSSASSSNILLDASIEFYTPTLNLVCLNQSFWFFLQFLVFLQLSSSAKDNSFPFVQARTATSPGILPPFLPPSIHPSLTHSYSLTFKSHIMPDLQSENIFFLTTSKFRMHRGPLTCHKCILRIHLEPNPCSPLPMRPPCLRCHYGMSALPQETAACAACFWLLFSLFTACSWRDPLKSKPHSMTPSWSLPVSSTSPAQCQ